MGRKNLFQPGGAKDAGAPKGSAPGSLSPAPPSGPGGRPGAVNPLSMLKNDRKNLIRDLRNDLIDDRAHADRLSLEGPDMDALVASIEAMGQTVPALVRPSPTHQGRFEIVYGRRRLEAVRRLGRPLRAAIHELSDEEALRVQGAENNQRLDPSFIEKAVFATRLLAEGDWSRDIISETLAIHESTLSRMKKIVSALGIERIEALGPCHDIGRRQWEELSEDILLLDRHDSAPSTADFSHFDPDARFEAFRTAVQDRLAQSGPAQGSTTEAEADAETPAPRASTSGDGPKRIRIPFGRTRNGKAYFENTNRGVNLRFVKGKDTDGFDDWLKDNVETVLESIHELWLEESAPETPETQSTQKKGGADTVP